MTDPEKPLAPETDWLKVGVAVSRLLRDPRDWIHRRVETIELLTHEESRRRISIDFSLGEIADDLAAGDGFIVPISPLAKKPRKHFDLRNSRGETVSALTRHDNARLSQVALANIAADTLRRSNVEISKPDAEKLSAEIRAIVDGPPVLAKRVANDFAYQATETKWRKVLLDDTDFRGLLDLLRENYILYVFLNEKPVGRQVLKTAFADEMHFNEEPTISEEIERLATSPDGREFRVSLNSPEWGTAYHLELVIPEELRAKSANFVDLEANQLVLAEDQEEKSVNRVALYLSSQDLDNCRSTPEATVTLIPERQGTILQGLFSGLAVTAALAMGVANDLAVPSSDSTVSILLGAAAVVTALSASHSEHILVTKIFSAPRFWTGAIALAATAGSLTLALGWPCEQPTGVWASALVLAATATIRLAWSARHAAGYPAGE